MGLLTLKAAAELAVNVAAKLEPVRKWIFKTS